MLEKADKVSSTKMANERFMLFFPFQADFLLTFSCCFAIWKLILLLEQKAASLFLEINLQPQKAKKKSFFD